MSPQANENSKNLQRQSVNYDPSVWGNFFITYACDNTNAHVWNEDGKILKEKIRKMLVEEFPIENLGQKLSIIDGIQRLGIAYHFEEEIQEMLHGIFKLSKDKRNYEDHQLTTLALLFRLLRQHGYYVSSDIFNKFIDNTNEIKEDLIEDLEGMLCLYEATHLKLQGEIILDKAYDFTKSALELRAPLLKPSLEAHVSHTLRWPIHKCLPRLGAREYIPFYQSLEFHDKLLLKFSKLDFNSLQIKHQEELKAISKWWKELDVKKNLSYARDRITECYFWILGVYYEPQYALARNFATKVIALTSVLDDTYDAYGTYEELVLLTNAFQRWDLNAKDELPKYMKVIYQAVLDTFSEMEEELVKQGRSFAISYARNAMKRQVKAYLDEAKWLVTKKVPTVEEYMTVATASTGYPLMAVISLVGMQEIVTNDVFDWLISEPDALQSVYRLCRVMDDVVSHQLERQREHIPSAVECYMKQHNVTANKACEELNKEVENAWMNINQMLVDSSTTSMDKVLLRILNLTRVMELLYCGEDFYTHPLKMKPFVASLLIHPFEI